MKLIMVNGGSIAHKAGSLITGGAFIIVSVPSASVKIDNNGVFRGPLQYTFSGGSSSGFDPGTITTTAPQSINPSAVKVKADGQSVVLEGDFGVMAAQGTIIGVPTPISGPVEVNSAGQNKVNAQ